MTTAQASQPQQAPSLQAGTNKWLKRLGILAAVIIVISIIINVFGGASSDWKSFGGKDEQWKPYSMVTHCKPVWNQNQGWCNVGEVPKGTYRIVPQYEVWQIKLLPSNPPQPGDQSYLPVPPKGLDISLWTNREFQQRFINSAPVKSRNYGALIVRADGKNFEALVGDEPREFLVTKATKIAINVNLTPQPLTYEGNLGEISIELQKRSE